MMQHEQIHNFNLQTMNTAEESAIAREKEQEATNNIGDDDVEKGRANDNAISTSPEGAGRRKLIRNQSFTTSKLICRR